MRFHRDHTIAARRQGLTLIELLVTLAIVALLIAVAAPNVIEANERAKVSVMRYEMRMVAEAASVFSADRGHLPHSIQECSGAGYMLTRPPLDRFLAPSDWLVFYARAENSYMPWLFDQESGRYLSSNDVMGGYVIGSVGPDGDWWNRNPHAANLPYAYWTSPWLDYDPTNGTSSEGNLFRTAKNTQRLGIPATAFFF